MDLLNSTYNKLERLALDADYLLTAALRRWHSWSPGRTDSAPNQRNLEAIEGIARGEAAGSPAGAEGGGRTAGAA
jgi:hypothetical protein